MHSYAFPANVFSVLLLVLQLLSPSFFAAPAAAQQIAVLGEVPLGPKKLFFRFSNAEIRVIVAVGEQYALRASYADDGTAAPMEWALGEDVLTVRRSGAEDRSLRVEAMMSPAQALDLEGTDLDLVLEASPELRDAERVWGGISLDLTDSQAAAAALRGLSIEARASILRLDDAAGEAVLTLREGSSVEVSQHTGAIELIAESSEARFDDVSGEIQASLKDAWLRFEGDAATVRLADISYAELVLAAPCVADLTKDEEAEVEMSGCERLSAEETTGKRRGRAEKATLRATVEAGSTLNVESY